LLTPNNITNNSSIDICEVIYEQNARRHFASANALAKSNSVVLTENANKSDRKVYHGHIKALFALSP